MYNVHSKITLLAHNVHGKITLPTSFTCLSNVFSMQRCVTKVFIIVYVNVFFLFVFLLSADLIT